MSDVTSSSSERGLLSMLERAADQLIARVDHRPVAESTEGTHGNGDLDTHRAGTAQSQPAQRGPGRPAGDAGADGTARAMSHSRTGRIVVAAVLAALVLLPFIDVQVPWVLPGSVDVVNSAGTLEVLGLCFVFGGVALGYDLQFGFTGLLSFGQVLYFAAGAYVFDMALSKWHWALLPSIGLTAGVGLGLALALGSLSLRVSGIAYSMVTLAFAQAMYYLIEDDPHGLTGGDTGLNMATGRLPGLLVGVSNTRNVYWLALVFLIVVYGVVWGCTTSRMGRVWLAIRENERRAEVLGLATFRFKLASVVISALTAVAGGVVYLIVVGTVAPDSVASTTVTIAILVMVVLGGVGRRWGAVAGAVLYVYLQQYLLKVAAEPSFASLPAPLRVPLSQPEFLLGALFIVFILFAPGGIAGLVERARLVLHRRASGASS
jgi:branched-chain amino acid transport system permease protein